ncbi:MAG: riboflavin synthase [Flavobacteriaceae bacterium]
MFTGIIETLGIIVNIEKEQDNLHFTLSSEITNELKVDQSVAHNGICLTVVSVENNKYTVTAIRETIEKTNVGQWKVSDMINLERAMKLGDRLDGHLVQGHIDQTAICTHIESANGSTYFTFEYDKSLENITIEKGSITVNGVSLTVVNSGINTFSVAIIPYTLEHTNFKTFEIGSVVNLEFDVIGKYVIKHKNIHL